MKKHFFYTLLCSLLFIPCALIAQDVPYILVNGEIPLKDGERHEEAICQAEQGATQVTFELVNPDQTLESVSVSWDFGDGITLDDADPAQVQTRDYTVEGWYDVKATLSALPVYDYGVTTITIPITIAFRIKYCAPVPPQCMDLKIYPEQASEYACDGTSFSLPYSIAEGAEAGDAFLVMEDGSKKAITLGEGTIDVDVAGWKPGIYNAYLQVADLNCETTVETPVFAIPVRYPNDLFTLLYNNVLAVYLRGQGGNRSYTFTQFQWYKNGLAIEGATKSMYHSEEKFQAGDEYYVLLTDDKGYTLPTCPLVIEEELPDYSPAEKPKAVKALIDRQMVVRLGDKTYDMYGQRVQ